MSNKKLVYADTDVGLGTPGAEIDDGAAMILLLRHPQIELVGAGSVFGNVDLPDAAMNLDRLLTWLEADHIPTGLGADKPILEGKDWFKDWQSGYGATLPWTARPAKFLAANLLIQSIRANPGQVSILSIGPMTNLALAARLDPGIIPLTRDVIVMGGSFNIQDPSPEFNARCDPEAARIVFDSGWNVHILGLDITRRVHFSRRDFASLPEENPTVALLKSQAPGWVDRMGAMGWDQDGCALHDAVAAAFLIDSSLFKSQTCCVEVELTEPRLRGLTRFAPANASHPTLNVVTDLDTGKCRDLIWSHLQI